MIESAVSLGKAILATARARHLVRSRSGGRSLRSSTTILGNGVSTRRRPIVRLDLSTLGALTFIWTLKPHDCARNLGLVMGSGQFYRQVQRGWQSPALRTFGTVTGPFFLQFPCKSPGHHSRPSLESTQSRGTMRVATLPPRLAFSKRLGLLNRGRFRTHSGMRSQWRIRHVDTIV